MPGYNRRSQFRSQSSSRPSKRWAESRASGARSQAVFTARARTAMARGRFAGHYRKSGYYGRYNRDTGTELKFLDTSIDDAIVSTTLTVQTAGPNLIPQGTAEDERVGRKVVVKSIHWRYRCLLPSSTSQNDTSEVIRVMLLLDKQCNGSYPGASEILQTNNDWQSFNNLSNKDRFVTLYDKTIALNSMGNGGNGTTNESNEVRHCEEFHKKVNIPINFDSTTGAVTEIASNNLVVALISEGGLPVFNSNMRIRFEG
ncbi:putative viral capsid [Circoviridae 4 LDMD-2013]|uniref:putative viral capsid n=1 Tax=Circoviridae 4 LDMD-2013 TaxID=1379708 RepID=UPI0003847257|nr:putative viral capsid [Circoviridae 4 LDMD-2013]AGS36186.1 putative viral capsid [Circoviridae 4 LDMD-2013]AGS36231.1 putative viral capsid [Circoviridae 17 LDMD-2013]